MASFQAHVELLGLFLSHRTAIVERLETLLNAQRKPADYLRNTALLSRSVDDACFAGAGTTEHQFRLLGDLEAAHWADGFKPRDMPGLHNGLADPAEMMVRAFYLWQRTRWPGRNGRVRYAHTLFNLSLVQRLTLLSMRIWDDGADEAAGRLAQVQQLLDRVWSGSAVEADLQVGLHAGAHADPLGQPILLRTAGWLIPMAQSPATDDLGAYFRVADKIATMPAHARLGIHKAGVLMAGGHLRSQLRHRATQLGVPLDDEGLIRGTRESNALDFALLIEDLTPLLEAYEAAVHGNDEATRRELAEIIGQGISADPELFLTRLDLLRDYSRNEGTGDRHAQLLADYETRIGRAAPALASDHSQFRPEPGTYSPYGVLYGFSTHLLEHMTLKASQPEAVTPFSLEDVFSRGDAAKLAWVNGWRKLPHITPDVARMFDYPQDFADAMFTRVEQALQAGQVGSPAPTNR